MTRMTNLPPGIVAAVSLNRAYLLGTLRPLLFALPLVLLLLPWPWKVAGVIYLVAWFIVVSASMGALFAIAYDALLIFLDRPPVVLPHLLYAYLRSRRRSRRTAVQGFHRFAALANYANPFANVVLAAVITATRLHPHRIQSVVQQVEMWLSAAKDVEDDLTEPTVEYSSGVLSHVAPRQSHEQHELLPA